MKLQKWVLNTITTIKLRRIIFEHMISWVVLDIKNKRIIFDWYGMNHLWTSYLVFIEYQELLKIYTKALLITW